MITDPCRKNLQMCVFWLLKPGSSSAESCGRDVSYISSDADAIAHMERLNHQGFLVQSTCPVFLYPESEERLRETLSVWQTKNLFCNLDRLMDEERGAGKDSVRQRQLRAIGQELIVRPPSDIESALIS